MHNCSSCDSIVTDRVDSQICQMMQIHRQDNLSSVLEERTMNLLVISYSSSRTIADPDMRQGNLLVKAEF